MNQIAMFEKVSFEQFVEDCIATGQEYTDEEIKKAYDEIILPKRATKGSAGYDFYSPFDFMVYPSTSTLVPTGVRCKIDDGWVLCIYPRSGHGFKYGVRLANSVGIIDSDYYFATNEGHIMVKLMSPPEIPFMNKSTMVVKQGERFCQGVFTPFGITKDDHIEAVRYGGMGSTGVE